MTRFGGESRLLVAYDTTRVHNLEQMRKDFVDNISHELRTPLTVLVVISEHLSIKMTSRRVGNVLFTQMQSQTKRMNALVNDLLLLSIWKTMKVAKTNY